MTISRLSRQASIFSRKFLKPSFFNRLSRRVNQLALSKNLKLSQVQKNGVKSRFFSTKKNDYSINPKFVSIDTSVKHIHYLYQPEHIYKLSQLKSLHKKKIFVNSFKEYSEKLRHIEEKTRNDLIHAYFEDKPFLFNINIAASKRKLLADTIDQLLFFETLITKDKDGSIEKEIDVIEVKSNSILSGSTFDSKKINSILNKCNKNIKGKFERKEGDLRYLFTSYASEIAPRYILLFSNKHAVITPKREAYYFVSKDSISPVFQMRSWYSELDDAFSVSSYLKEMKDKSVEDLLDIMGKLYDPPR